MHGRSDQRISKHAQLGASYFDARLIATELFFYSGARLRGGEGGAEVRAAELPPSCLAGGVMLSVDLVGQLQHYFQSRYRPP